MYLIRDDNAREQCIAELVANSPEPAILLGNIQTFFLHFEIYFSFFSFVNIKGATAADGSRAPGKSLKFHHFQSIFMLKKTIFKYIYFIKLKIFKKNNPN